jgi:oligopeptidase B
VTSISKPPVAPERPTELTTNGDTRVDPWYWLREKDNPEVISHLEAENAYTAHVMASTQGAQQYLYDEIVARIQETDLSVPVKKGDWWYYHRTEEGKQYGIHCRKADDNGKPVGEETSSKEIVLFDENREADGHDFFDMGAFDISPDGYLLAYSTDYEGNEIFTMRVRDLRTNEDLADRIENTSYGTAWSRDGSVLFYIRRDQALRPFQVWRHVIGTPTHDDTLMFQEDDERFHVGVGNSRTEDYVTIGASSTLTTEIHLLRSDDPLGDFTVVEPRREGIEYHLAHHRSENGDRFFVTTNENAPNFKLMVTSADALGAENWKPLIEHRPDVKLDGAECFSKHLVLSERADANTRIAIYDLTTEQYRVLEQPEPVYTAHTSGNAEFDTTKLRFGYSSLVTPGSVYQVDLETGERELLKQQPVLGTFNSDDYVSERVWATAADGTKVPVSLVYRKDRPEEPGPALLYGYGSYEISIDPTFSSLRLSLLDRGFVFAIAHIRGGGDLGRAWYENGKFLHKKNTFTDFVTCAEHLVEKGYTTPDQLVIRGGSAGGLLMGAVTNMRPDLFAAVVAEVPFVDVLTTMLDTSLPLTVGEFEEWGNPQEPEFYDYMKSYSPYDNVAPHDYPRMLVTAGLNDPRVSYWEPTKWVQRLRAENTSQRDILLKTEMGAGHSGPSGRYDTWRDEAFIYAFMLQTLGIRVRLT